MEATISALTAKYSKTYKRMRKAIEKYDRICVFRHIKPDYDAMGSQMGLVTFLKDNFPSKEIRFVGDNHSTFTPRLFPETERLPEEWFASPFLAIVVDVGEPSRIADPRFEKGETVIKFDHHPTPFVIAKDYVLEPESGSAAELVASFCLSWKGKKMSPEAAHYFYIGIVGDTGRFMYSSTNTHTFEVAQRLVETGFPLHDTYLDMYEKKIDDLKVTAYVLNHFEVSPHGVAYYVLPADIQEKLKITSERGKENVNLFSNIDGINAWCSISEDPNPKDWCWRISIRSKRVDISGVANRFGGGGHANASGARIQNLDELPSLIAALDELFE